MGVGRSLFLFSSPRSHSRTHSLTGLGSDYRRFQFSAPLRVRPAIRLPPPLRLLLSLGVEGGNGADGAEEHFRRHVDRGHPAAPDAVLASGGGGGAAAAVPVVVIVVIVVVAEAGAAAKRGLGSVAVGLHARRANAAVAVLSTAAAAAAASRRGAAPVVLPVAIWRGHVTPQGSPMGC